MTARLTRRVLLGAAAAAVSVSAAGAAAPLELRIGAVLPLGGPSPSDMTDDLGDVAESARRGIAMGEEEMQRNGGLFGHTVRLFMANAPGAGAAERAARRLVAHDRVQALVGGFTEDDARALSAVAEEAGVLFLNIAAPSDALRRACGAQTFHIEASAAMYLDALAGWYVRAGHRRWFVVHGAGDEQAARLDRARRALGTRHWGARIVGDAQVGGHDFEAVLGGIAAAEPDAVLLLTDWHTQLAFLARYEAEGLAHPVAAFPEAATQTRKFYADALNAAPRAAAGHRAALWEATLDAYGARELNARAAARWGRPLDPAGWAGFLAMKIAFEAAQFGGAADGAAMAAHLADPGTVLDAHKGIGVSFRPWDHQLRQSLYLVKLDPAAGAARDLATLEGRAHLVGELPAIYMPGTDPVERLDQLGDLDPGRRCGP